MVPRKDSIIYLEKSDVTKLNWTVGHKDLLGIMMELMDAEHKDDLRSRFFSRVDRTDTGRASGRQGL